MTPEARFSLLSFHTRRVSNLYPLKRHTTYILLQNPILNFCYVIFLIFGLTNHPHIAESLEHDSSSTNQDFLRKTEPATCHYAEWYRVHNPYPISLRSISILSIGPRLDLLCGPLLPGIPT
jgi:hypothetical protein